MLDHIVIWIYAAGIVQALFLAGSLLTLKIRNQIAARALTAIILLLAVALIEQLADSSGASVEFALSLALEFALAPLLFIFIRAIAVPGWRVSRQTALHFVPMLLALAALGLMHVTNQAGNLGVSHPQFGNLIITLVFVKLAYFTAYAVPSEATLRRAVKTAKPRQAALLQWIYRWLLLVYVAFAISYFIFILFIVGVDIWRDSDVYAGIAVFVIVFSIAYFVLANRKVLDFVPQHVPPASLEVRKNADFISAHVQAERPHQEPDFSLEQLASSTELSVSAVQAAVTYLDEGGFSDYVNRLRLEEFQRIARDPQNKTKTTLELAFAAGFNSKATFYRVFNAEKAMTPRAFRESLKTI